MKLLTCIKKFIANPVIRMGYLSKLGFYDHMGDERYLKKSFKVLMGKDLNLENPQTFNEKLQWLKLHDRKPEYTVMVDKYKVRDYIAQVLGPEYLIPLLGVWNDPSEIDFDALPNQFVLKCNHNSSTGLCICKDKSKLDIGQAKRELSKALKEDFYLHGREWPYKNVPRRIIAEKYMEDSPSSAPGGVGQLTDYKVFVFEGKPYCIQVDFDRFINHRRNLYDVNWNYLPFTTNYPTDPNHVIKKPDSLEELLAAAEKIARSLNNPHFVRTDFYIVDGHIYFGEITFYHECGLVQFYPQEYDYKLGELIKI